MKYVFIGVLAVFLSVFISCQSGTEPERMQVPVSGNTFTFNNLDDTLFVYGTALLDVAAELNTGNNIDSLVGYLDNTRFLKQLNLNSISLNSTFFTNGTYNLRLLLYSYNDSTQSGGRENFVDELETVVVINNSPPPARSILFIAPRDGYLQIEWNEYTVFNFQQYRVQKQLAGSSSWRDLATITDPAVTKWSNFEYVGGDDLLRIVIEAANHQVGSNPRAPVGSNPNILSVSLEDGKQVIRWTQCPYDSAFAAYRFQIGAGGTQSTFQDFKRITEIDSVELTLPSIIFGQPVAFRYFLEAKDQSTSSNSNIAVQTLGESFQPFTKLIHLPALDRIYTYRFENAKEYEASTMSLIASHSFEPMFSSDGSRAYRRKPVVNRVDDMKSFFAIDPQSLQNLQEYNTGNFIGYDSFVGDGPLIPASNNRLWYVGLTYTSPTFFFDKIFLIDLMQETLVYKFDQRNTILEASSTGEYLLLASPTTLYRFNGSQLSAMRSVNSSVSFAFHPDDTHYIITADSKLDVYDLATNSLVRRIDVSEAVKVPTVDPKTGYVGCYSNSSPSGIGNYYIYDIYTGELKKTFRVVTDGFTAFEKGYVIADGKIFSNRGYYLPLDLD